MAVNSRYSEEMEDDMVESMSDEVLSGSEEDSIKDRTENSSAGLHDLVKSIIDKGRDADSVLDEETFNNQTINNGDVQQKKRRSREDDETFAREMKKLLLYVVFLISLPILTYLMVCHCFTKEPFIHWLLRFFIDLKPPPANQFDSGISIDPTMHQEL